MKWKQNEIRNKGNQMEHYVASLLPNSKVRHPWAEYDLDYKDTFVEVKSAELRVSQGNRNSSRAGKFLTRKYHHAWLNERNGWYAFILTIKGQPVYLRFRKANEPSPHYIGQGEKQYIWFSLLELYKGKTLERFLKEVG